jgi:hypothetical protein
MQVSFDSNAWEKVFDPADRDWALVRSAISSGRITGFICEAAFRIEAIRKRERAAYFAEPAMDVQFPFSTVIRNGKPTFKSCRSDRPMKVTRACPRSNLTS